MTTYLRFASLVLLLGSLAACGSDGLGPGEADTCRAITTRAACTSRSDCEPAGCVDCDGKGFDGCYAVGTAPETACPAIACAPRCGDYLTEASCDAQPGCHSVFSDDASCRCITPGCCARFDHCSALPVVCDPEPNGALCDALPPHCEGPYTVAYTDTCYAGCVRKSDCP